MFSRVHWSFHEEVSERTTVASGFQRCSQTLKPVLQYFLGLLGVPRKDLVLSNKPVKDPFVFSVT